MRIQGNFDLIFFGAISNNERDNDELDDKRPRKLYENVKNVFNRYILLNYALFLSSNNLLIYISTFESVCSDRISNASICINFGKVKKSNLFSLKVLK